jgi:hypothetical protein
LTPQPQRARVIDRFRRRLIGRPRRPEQFGRNRPGSNTAPASYELYHGSEVEAERMLRHRDDVAAAKSSAVKNATSDVDGETIDPATSWAWACPF